MHAFLLSLIGVRLHSSAGNDAEVARTGPEVLKDTPCHLPSYLLDYYLAQLQASDWALASPYMASPSVNMAWKHEDGIELHVKKLRSGCYDIDHMLLTTEAWHVFGFTSLNH